MSNKNYKFETLQLHVGQEQPDPATAARAVPIYQTTSYVFRNSAHAAARFGLADAGNIYGRLTNSTQDVLEKRLAALEGGVAALAVSSGAAAIDYTIQALAGAGEHIVAQKTIYGFKEQDIDTIKQSAKDWEKKYNDAIAESNRKIADMEFSHALDAAITGAKGKSTKAIRALLDIDTLRSSKNQETDIKAALEALRKDSGYLFDDGKMPPPYAGKTGTGQQETNGEPTTLAGALRANYNMK